LLGRKTMPRAETTARWRRLTVDPLHSIAFGRAGRRRCAPGLWPMRSGFGRWGDGSGAGGSTLAGSRAALRIKRSLSIGIWKLINIHQITK
jgi:hypothetical protein